MYTPCIVCELWEYSYIEPVFWKFLNHRRIYIVLRRERTWIDSYRCETQNHIIDPVSRTVATKS